jgi:hypothetical protein
MTERFMSAAHFRDALELLHERGISMNKLHRFSNAAATSRAAGAASARRAMSRWLSIKIRRTLPFGAGFVQNGLQIAAQVQ